MIVELVGAPAAGKSYLAPALAAQSGVPVIEIGRWGQKYLYFCLFALMNWKATRRVIRESRLEIRAHPEMRHVKKIRTFMRMGAKVAKARLFGRGLVIEGIFQTLTATFEEPVAASTLESYFNLVRWKPDVVFIIKADRDLRMRRMRSRQSIPRERLGAAHWQRSLAVVEANLRTLETILTDRGNTVIYENNGTDTSRTLP